MEIGIIGLPLSGKTTIFNALSGQNVHLSSASGGKSQINLAEVEVPDPRVEEMAALFNRKKRVQAVVLFKDIQVEFTKEGGLSAVTLAEIRNTDAIAITVRVFADDAVFHPLERVDPLRDLRKILDSLIFSDYEIIEKRLERLAKEAKRSSREYQVLERLSELLSSGRLIGKDFLNDDPGGKKLLSGYRFLAAKPIIVVANTGASITRAESWSGQLETEVSSLGLEFFTIRGDLEMEISQLPEEDQREFMEDLGLTETAKNRFLTQIYKGLNLISFLTIGEEEVRAWSVTRGTSALNAAGKIHSDLERGFIRAEVIFWQELISAGGFLQAKKQGKLRLEGKNYPVQDGDVITIRFNI